MQEILSHDSSARICLGGGICFEVGGNLSADVVSLPRFVTLHLLTKSLATITDLQASPVLHTSDTKEQVNRKTRETCLV